MAALLASTIEDRYAPNSEVDVVQRFSAVQLSALLLRNAGYAEKTHSTYITVVLYGNG